MSRSIAPILPTEANVELISANEFRGRAEVGSRVPAIVRECRHGTMAFLPGDKYIGRSLGLYGEFSEIEGQLFSRLLRPDDVVIEGGANIGAHTVHLAKLVGPRGKVLAYEPQRAIFRLLRANLALNKLSNVRALQAAVGRRAGWLPVPVVNYAAKGNFGGVSLRNARSGHPVRVIALDSLRLSAVRLLKLDVEGMEIAALRGARRLISRHRPLLYVENDRPENSRTLVGLIARFGYQMWWHLPPLFNPRNYAGNRANVFGRIVSANLLCAPRETAETIEQFLALPGPAVSLHRCD